MSESTIWKPTPAHHPLLAPAVCMCADCSRKVAALRCEAVAPTGERCGDYKRHRGGHTMLVCTSFLLAEHRAAEVEHHD